MWAVVMPFFEPVPTGDREKHLPAIEKALEIFAENGKMYADDDVRWRHVVVHKDGEGNERTILCDLADLVDVGTNKEAAVQKQISILNERISDEAAENPLPMNAVEVLSPKNSKVEHSSRPCV